MSQQNAVQPKYQLVMQPGTGVPTPTKRGRGRPARFNDVEQAVNSITYTTNNSAAVAARGKANMVLDGTPLDKADKILFIPKYVQKKVTVMRDTPKKALASPGGSGQPPLKKKKLLGDLALQSWAPKRTEPDDDIAPASMLCRVCGSIIEDTVVGLITPNGELSTLGNKLKTIIGAEIADNPLSPTSCCKPCSFKINVCFTLLLELQASDTVVRLTYSELQEGDLINPAVHIYTCSDCGQEVVGMKEFITHFESHMQTKTIGSNVAKVQPKEEIIDDDIVDQAQLYLDEDIDDGSIIYQNEAGELICEKCGRTFKYRFLLQLHRKAPKRGHLRDSSPPAKVCFVCKQARVSTVSSGGYCEHLAPTEEGLFMECTADEESDSESQPPIEFVHDIGDMGQGVQAESSEYEGTSDAPEMQWEESSEEEEISPKQPVKKKSMKKEPCPICNKIVKADTMAVHILRQHEKGRFQCDVCDEDFAYQALLKMHKRSHQALENEGENYPVRVNCCQFCDLKFQGLFDLREHLKNEHGEDWTASNHFSCRHCRKPFHDFFRMRMHLLLYHDIDLPKKFLKRKGAAECEVCKKTLKSEYQLKLHLKQEHNLTSAQMDSLKEACEECGKRFSVRMNLINHINSSHRQFKPLECDECGERFVKCSSLIMHKRRHTGEKPFVCCVCQRPYRQRNDVLRHLARHVRDKEIIFEEAYAMNTSASSRVTMRYIYLKDSNQKGISDMVDNGPVRKVTKVRQHGSMKYITIRDGEVPLEPIEEDMSAMQYVVNDEGNLVLQETTEETVVENGNEEGEGEPMEQYVLVDGAYVGPDGTKYKLEESDEGANILVKIDETIIKQEIDSS